MKPRVWSLGRGAPQRRLRSFFARSSDGVAAVDALIALVILSTTVALSLQTVDTARRVAARASEMRQAEVQLRAFSDAATSSIGYQTGRTDRFAWRVSLTSSDGGEASLRTCAKLVELQSLTSGRAYRLATATPCPPTGGA